MSLYNGALKMVRGESRSPVDFTEALLMLGIALGAKALGIW